MSEPTPAPANSPASPSVRGAPVKRPKTPPRSIESAGLLFGTLVLLFFMVLVVASVFEYSVPCDSRFLVVVVFALGVALAFSFIGGTAAAKGQLPLPALKEHPVAVGATGGFAALLIILLVGSLTYASGADCSDVFQRVELRGKVLDEQSQPISGAQITVEGQSFLASTSATGDFEGELHRIRTGAVLTVHVTHPDFNAQTQPMKVSASTIVLANFQLKRFR